MTKRELVVASTWHHCARLLKYYPRALCTPSFVKSRMLLPLQTHFLLFQQIFFILVCIHVGNPRVPPRVLASRPTLRRQLLCLHIIIVTSSFPCFILSYILKGPSEAPCKNQYPTLDFYGKENYHYKCIVGIRHSYRSCRLYCKLRSILNVYPICGINICTMLQQELDNSFPPIPTSKVQWCQRKLRKDKQKIMINKIPCWWERI